MVEFDARCVAFVLKSFKYITFEVLICDVEYFQQKYKTIQD